MFCLPILTYLFIYYIHVKDFHDNINNLKLKKKSIKKNSAA